MPHRACLSMFQSHPWSATRVRKPGTTIKSARVQQDLVSSFRTLAPHTLNMQVSTRRWQGQVCHLSCCYDCLTRQSPEKIPLETQLHSICLYRCHGLSLQRIDLAITSVTSLQANQTIVSESECTISAKVQP